MDRFYKFHPIVQAVFFIACFVLVMSVNNPFFSAVSLVCSVLYSLRLKGKEIFSTIKFCTFLIIFASLFNMLFAHYGEDVLFTVKDTQFTLEALFYGFNQGMVVSSVILWFIAFGEIMDSEKIIYILRLTPKCALIFSMVLGFMPRFIKKHYDIKAAKTALYGNSMPKGFRNKLKSSAENFSALVSYSLESSIITSDSMLARGYNPKAVRYNRFKITAKDVFALLILTAFAVCVFVQMLRGEIIFVFDPEIYCESFSALAFSAFVLFQLFPLIVDLWEDLLWRLSIAKI